ncbi:MFS transporter [Streptomyces sp. NPDC087659]|uniref:MFS transporter n=1 Tax=Streptomyces sp. NPDC087659 TaxID=3365801 RepID=UPI0037F964D5
MWPFWTVTAIIFVAMAASSTPSPLYGLYQQRWHFSTVTTTIVYASYAAGAVATLLVAGSLRAHIGRRQVLLLSVTVLGSSFLLFLIAPGIWALYLARLVQGIGVGLLTSSAGAALADLHPRKSLHSAAVANSAATPAGIAFGAVLSGLAAEHAPAPLMLPFAALTALSVLGLIGIAAIPVWEPPQRRLRTWRPRRLRVDRAARRLLLREAPTVIVGWSVVGLYLALGVELAASVMHTSDRALSSLVILVVQGCGGAAPLLWRRSQPHQASIRGCAAIVAGTGLSITGLLGDHPLMFFAGAAVTGGGFGLTFMGSLGRVTAAARGGGTVSAFYAIAYVAVSVPIVAVGAAESLVGLRDAFTGFGLIVALLAVAAGALTLSSPRPKG